VLALCAGLAACGENAPQTPGAEPATPQENPSGGNTAAPSGSPGSTTPGSTTPGSTTPGEPAAPTTHGDRPVPTGLTENDLAAAAAAANQFAFELFRQGAPAGQNAVISPLNVRHALALAWAGAGGQTREAMASAMHFSGGSEAEDAQHLALAGLVAHALTAQGEADERPEVSFASRIWVQEGLGLTDGFRPRIEAAYGSGFEAIDIGGDPEGARGRINQWVSGQTRDRIPEVLPMGSISGDTRLVLSAAVYLNAGWVGPFEPESTRDGSFTLAGGEPVDVPMMHQTRWRDHAVTDSYTAVELPYANSPLAMLVVMPTAATLEQFESEMDAPAWAAIVESLGSAEVRLTMPKFEFDTAADLSDPLRAMGMGVAFTENADFSRMTRDEELMIGGVFHGAFLRVDEAGTEAAAATAVTMNVTSAPMEEPEPVVVTIDRPFMLAIRDRETGAVLFLGRVVDPR
jgi:serpin B